MLPVYWPKKCKRCCRLLKEPTAVNVPPLPSNGSTTAQEATVERQQIASFEVGIGFEAGSVMRPGFSAALDILLSVSRINGAFHSAMPMPQVALIYSW